MCAERNELEKLRPYDIVCGRESVSYNNIGNRRFRIFISLHLNKYTEAEGRRRKGQVIRSLLHILTNEIGARFFRFSHGKLVELTENQIRQKVGHALRDMASFNASSKGRKKSLATVDGGGRSEPEQVRSSLAETAQNKADSQTSNFDVASGRVLMNMPRFHDIGVPDDAQEQSLKDKAKLKSESSPESIECSLIKGGRKDFMASIDDSIFSMDNAEDDDHNQVDKEPYR